MTTTRQKRGLGQAGITLIELTIAAAIAGMLALVMSTMLTTYNRSMKVAEEKAKAAGEGLLGTRALWHDVRQAGISFNLLNEIKDDSGTRNFYDFLPDAPCASNCSRTLTLTEANAKMFVMAMTSDGLSAPTPLAPGHPSKGFYDQPAPVAPATTGTITFNATKFKTEVNAADTVGAATPGKKMWKAGRILRFYSPFYQRPIPNSAPFMPNMSATPGLLSFIGVVNPAETAVSPLTAAVATEMGIGTQRRSDMLSSDPDSVIDNVDEFFRFLPPVGGTGAFGLVVPIDIVRYQIRNMTYEGKQMPCLVRERHNGTAFASARVIAAPVESLVLFRETITVPSIKPSLKIAKKAYRDIMRTQ